MAQVAINGTAINQSTRSNYISYRYRIYDSERYFEGYDEDGYPMYSPGYWYYDDYSNAIINGAVECNNKVYANGVSIAKAGDIVKENWTNSGFKSEYVSGSASPGTNGSGNGTIDSNANSNKVFINGSLVAIKGSSVTTHLSTKTQLNAPVASKVFVG